jgi:hypothetical protein
MTRKFLSSAVDHSLAAKYLTKANRFKADAENMAQLSDEFSGNGVAVLCVHAAIAYGDAIAILAAGKKSKSGDHRDAEPFLSSVVPIRTVEDKAAIRAFQAILNRGDSTLPGSPSKQLNRINIQRPPHPPCALQLLNLRQPPIEKPMQSAALNTLHQQLRMMTPRPFGHRRRNRAQQLDVARRLGDLACLC